MAAFTLDKIAQDWLDIFDGPIQANYVRWQETGGERRTWRLGRALDIGRRAVSRTKRRLLALQKRS